jgi:hypothetical protein
MTIKATVKANTILYTAKRPDRLSRASIGALEHLIITRDLSQQGR